MAHEPWAMDHGLRTTHCRLQTNGLFFKKTLLLNWGQQYATDFYVIENSVCICEKYLEEWKRETSPESSSGFRG